MGPVPTTPAAPVLSSSSSVRCARQVSSMIRMWLQYCIYRPWMEKGEDLGYLIKLHS
jgi:hypothetical protein